MLQTGDPAPDFQVGERSLHQMLGEGKVVVFFFPKTFTAG
jgi:peroxiredoxin